MRAADLRSPRDFEGLHACGVLAATLSALSVAAHHMALLLSDNTAVKYGPLQASFINALPELLDGPCPCF